MMVAGQAFDDERFRAFADKATLVITHNSAFDRKFVEDRYPIFRALQEVSGEMTTKICAVGAPYDKKDILKQHGYRWNDGTNNGCKGWWINVPQHLE